MAGVFDLPVRVFPDLSIEVAPGITRLTPDQGLHVAQSLIAAAVRRQISDRAALPVRRSPTMRGKAVQK